MKFGLSFLPDVTPSMMPPSVYFDNALLLSQFADARGLHTIKMTEHYLHAYGGYCPSPLSFLSAVAARTSRVRLMSGGALPVFHHPIQLASETAMLDAISGGRLDVGVARAYMPYEFTALGVPIDESRERFVATVEAMVRLWTEERVTIATPFFSFEEATALPRPTQLPHPPLWVAASLSPESFEWIGRKGYNLLATFLLGERSFLKELLALYRAARAASGSNPGEIALSVPLYVADSDARAFEEGGRWLERYFRVWADGAAAWRPVQSPAYRGYTHMADVIRDTSVADLLRTRRLAFGCPERVLDHVRWLQDEFGVDHVLWQVDFGGMPLAASLANVSRFVDDVMPCMPTHSGPAFGDMRIDAGHADAGLINSY